METLERRAVGLALAAVILLAFDRPADFTSQRGTGWQVAVYVAGLLCIGGAAALSTLVLAPADVVAWLPEKRERLLFAAFVAVVAAVISVILLRVYGTIYFHRHPTAGFAP